MPDDGRFGGDIEGGKLVTGGGFHNGIGGAAAAAACDCRFESAGGGGGGLMVLMDPPSSLESTVRVSQGPADLEILACRIEVVGDAGGCEAGADGEGCGPQP